MGGSQWFGQMVRVLEGAWLGNGDKEVWFTKIFGEEVCGLTSLNGQKNERVFVFHLNAHQRVISAEEDINNQLDRMTCSVDIGQSLSPVTLSSPRGLMNKVTMVAGMVVTHRLSNMDSTHQGWPGYGHPECPICQQQRPIWHQSPVWLASHLVAGRAYWLLPLWKGSIFFQPEQVLGRDIDFAFCACNASAKTTICGLMECLMHCHGIMYITASDQGTHFTVK